MIEAAYIQNTQFKLLGRISLDKLTKSSTVKALFGVCGGIADFFGISSFIVRFLAWSFLKKPSL